MAGSCNNPDANGICDDPYPNLLTITLYGTEESPEIPEFGNKVIGMQYGTLDLHGLPKTPSWTELASTADVGATSITLTQAVNWVVGDKIAIAPTSFEKDEAEDREIKTISSDGLTITFDDPLQFKHFSGRIYFGDDTATIDDSKYRYVRAEVGCLTRNLIFKGDDDHSKTNLYGAHIMVHRHTGKEAYAKITNVEMTMVGQSFQLRRYPIHFHMQGNVPESFAKNNVIHHSFSRCITIHAVNYVTVEGNVCYDTFGHGFFVEDGVETHNIIKNNLGMVTRISWSLLSTDQNPATFWQTNPDNTW